MDSTTIKSFPNRTLITKQHVIGKPISKAQPCGSHHPLRLPQQSLSGHSRKASRLKDKLLYRRQEKIVSDEYRYQLVVPDMLKKKEDRKYVMILKLPDNSLVKLRGNSYQIKCKQNIENWCSNLSASITKEGLCKTGRTQIQPILMGALRALVHTRGFHSLKLKMVGF